ncbi:MAG: DUF2953 domain-containing protein [Nitrososphaerales archaeon]
MLLELLAIVLLSLLVLILSVLLIPFQVFLEASMTGTSAKSDIMVRWLGLTVWRTKPKKRRRESEQAKTTKKKKPRREFDVGRLLRMLTLLRDSGSALAIIAGSIRRAVTIRRVSADVTFGLGDPAETALLAGYLWSVSWIPNLSPRISLSVRPDMERLRLDGSITAQSSVRLFPLVAGFLRAYSRRSFRLLIKEARS